MDIALFTPYAPTIGGGSVQLRSHIAQFPELNVQWYYLAPEPVAGGNWHHIGRPLSPIQFTLDIYRRAGFFPGSTAPIRQIADTLHADLYWIVGHYEGISLAHELLSRGKSVHLTIHDEPLAMLLRSRRFRPLLPAMARVFPKVLRAVKSVDVTSKGLRDCLKRKYQVDSFVVYRYLPELPSMVFRPTDGELTVGHIGSLYHPSPFRTFVLACRELAAAQNRALKIVRIGSSPEMDVVASENLAPFAPLGELSEEDALPILAACDFVYAMYPAGFRFRGFRRTSLPIKLSTYIRAQRPIFAHTPADSGLAELISQFKVGEVCSSNQVEEVRVAIERLMRSQVTHEHFEKLRSELMGINQVRQLKSALTSQA